eukprot:9415864-Lingulodinium_polyedra.AAC.1
MVAGHGLILAAVFDMCVSARAPQDQRDNVVVFVYGHGLMVWEEVLRSSQERKVAVVREIHAEARVAGDTAREAE